MKTHVLLFVILSLSFCGLLCIVYFIPHQSKLVGKDQKLLQLAAGLERESNRFSSRETEFEFQLTYEWEDFETNDFSVSFSLSKDALKEAEDEFGYYPDELDRSVERNLVPLRREMIIHLKQITQKFIKKSKYSKHFFISEDFSDRFNVRMSAPPSMQNQIRTEFKRLTSEIARHQKKYDKKIQREGLIQKEAFLYKKGLRYIKDKIGVNYSLLVKNNQERLKQVFQSLLFLSKGMKIPQFLSFILSYIQEVRYGIPPLIENGKYIMGFWVPPKVLINNFGDCDSKGVTFASLWVNFKKYPILLIRIPKHLFIGLAVPSFSEEGVTVNGLRYTLCEVTGPDKLPPGMIAPYSQLYFESGNYSYELIR